MKSAWYTRPVRLGYSACLEKINNCSQICTQNAAVGYKWTITSHLSFDRYPHQQFKAPEMKLNITLLKAEVTSSENDHLDLKIFKKQNASGTM